MYKEKTQGVHKFYGKWQILANNHILKIKESVSTATSAMLCCGAATSVETLSVFLRGGYSHDETYRNYLQWLQIP